MVYFKLGPPGQVHFLKIKKRFQSHCHKDVSGESTPLLVAQGGVASRCTIAGWTVWDVEKSASARMANPASANSRPGHQGVPQATAPSSEPCQQWTDMGEQGALAGRAAGSCLVASMVHLADVYHSASPMEETQLWRWHVWLRDALLERVTKFKSTLPDSPSSNEDLDEALAEFACSREPAR